MPRIRLGDISLNYLDHGRGDHCVLAVHGNLGCAQWLDLVTPRLPEDIRVIAAEWRGCGDSDKPAPAEDFANYAMPVHARDHLALLDALGIARCHLYGHSTGGIIISHMLRMAPGRFGKVLMLDPVSPRGLALGPGQLDILAAMKTDRDICYAGMATAAPTLFRPETLAPGQRPEFAATTTRDQREVFALIIDRTRMLSDGIWFGTPHHLALEWASGELARQMPHMTQEHLILCGGLDTWIPEDHLEAMVRDLPNARLERFPEVGHSMNLEQPAQFARIFADYLGAASGP